jgi:ribosome modulation factor
MAVTDLVPLSLPMVSVTGTGFVVPVKLGCSAAAAKAPIIAPSSSKACDAKRLKRVRRSIYRQTAPLDFAPDFAERRVQPRKDQDDYTATFQSGVVGHFEIRPPLTQRSLPHSACYMLSGAWSEFMDISDIFGQGIVAYGAATPRDDCPYPVGSDEREVWQDGWDEAKSLFGKETRDNV